MVIQHAKLQLHFAILREGFLQVCQLDTGLGILSLIHQARCPRQSDARQIGRERQNVIGILERRLEIALGLARFHQGESRRQQVRPSLDRFLELQACGIEIALSGQSAAQSEMPSPPAPSSPMRAAQ